MNKKLRKFLEQNGLRADATDKEAWDLYDNLKKDGIGLPGVVPGERSASGAPAAGDPQEGSPSSPPAGNPAAGGSGSDDGVRTMDDTEVKRMIADGITNGLEADRSRRSDVQEMIDVAGVAGLDGGEFARTLLDNPHTDRAAASEQIFTRLAKDNQAFGIGAQGAQVGTEAPEKLRAAVTDGLLMRTGTKIVKPADGAVNFRGRSLVGICRELLEMSGVVTRGLSRTDIVNRTLSSTSTSDFPLIFAGLANTTMLNAYTEWPETWRQFVAIGSANDFRDMHTLKLSGAPDLKGISENGEFQSASFSESGEKYRLVEKGIFTTLSRQMIINDDLRAFTTIPRLFGASARRMESAAVYSLITSNPVMSDGKNLFHADRKNLAGTGTVISGDSLDIGRTAMRTQKGMAGESLNIIPAFLLTPVSKETVAEVLLRSTALPDADMSSGVHNPWSGKLTPVSDPAFDDADPLAWYMLAHPNQAPVIEASWLEGDEQPYVEEDVQFLSGAIKIGCRHDFGAGLVDHVGAYKNSGV